MTQILNPTMSKQTIGLDDRLYNYLLSVSLREPEILQQLRQETNNHPQAIMQISPEQSQFMALLVQLLGAKKLWKLGYLLVIVPCRLLWRFRLMVRLLLVM